MGQELVEGHIVVRVERDPVVIIGEKVALTAYSFNLTSKDAPVLPGNMLQKGVSEDEVNAAVLYGQATTVSHDRVVRPRVIRAVDVEVASVEVDYQILGELIRDLRHSICWPAYLQAGVCGTGFHGLKKPA